MKTVQFKTWAAAVAVGAGLLLATGARAQVMNGPVKEYDFSSLAIRAYTAGNENRTYGTVTCGRLADPFFHVTFVTRTAPNPVVDGDNPFSAANNSWYTPSGDTIFANNNSIEPSTTNLLAAPNQQEVNGVTVTHTGALQQPRDMFIKLGSTSAKRIVLVCKANNAARFFFNRFAVANDLPARPFTNSTTGFADNAAAYSAAQGFAILRPDGTGLPGVGNFDNNTYLIDGSSIRGAGSDGTSVTTFDNGVRYVLQGVVPSLAGDNMGFAWVNNTDPIYTIIDGFTSQPGQVLAIGGTRNGDAIRINKMIVVPADAVVPVTAVNILNTTTDKVIVGTKLQMVAKATPVYGDYTWSVVNGTGSATIDVNGVLTGVAVGTVTVKATGVDATDQPVEDAVEISIVAETLAESVEITGIPAHAIVGDALTYTLGATVLPNETTFPAVTWSVTGSTGATIDAVTGVLSIPAYPTGTPGVATVRATVIGTPTVFADSAITIYEVPAESIEIEIQDGEKEAGTPVHLTAVVLPYNTTYKEHTWTITSDGGTGATINENGRLTVPAAGTVVVRAAVDRTPSVFADSTITFVNVPVTGITISRDITNTDTVGLWYAKTWIATITPAHATNKAVDWVSDNTAVATVSEAGLVKAIGEGTATITATTKDGTNLSANAAINVNPAKAAPIKQEKLVIYENFGGENPSEALTPTKWAAIHADSQADARQAGWRARSETAAVGLGNTGYAVTPQPSSGSNPYHIDSILKYKPSVGSLIEVEEDDMSYTYAGIQLHNGYLAVVGGAPTNAVGFNLLNAAVFPDFYNPLCYDTVIAPGGHWATAIGQPGWEKSYTIPTNSKTFYCNRPDDKGYIAFANGKTATVGATTPTLTIPAGEGSYLPDVSKVEVDFSGLRVAQIGLLVVVAEHFDVAGVTTKRDTFTYSSINYTPRKAVVPVNGERVKLYISVAGGANVSFWDYPHTNATGVTALLQSVEPYTFNRSAIANSTTGNIGLGIYAVKVYANVDAEGYELTLNNGAAGKSSGIAYGETVEITAPADNSGNAFRGWRISGRPDLSEKANPLTLTVTENLTITPLYVGDNALVAVVNETFTEQPRWEERAKISDADTVGAKFLHFASQAGGDLATYALVDSLVVPVPLYYGFKTPDSADFINVTLRYCNVAPNSTIRLHDAPGAEQWRGFIGFGALNNDSKGYFEIDTLAGIQKAEVELSSYDVAPSGAGQTAVAVFKNDTLIRNVADLRHFDARRAEIEVGSNPSKLTIGYANMSTHEFLVTVDTGATIPQAGYANKLIPDTYGSRVKRGVPGGKTLFANARYAAMHSLKLYAEVVLPPFSDDATLRSLEITLRTAVGDRELTLNKEFHPDTLAYAVAEERLLDSVVVINPIANHTMARLEGEFGVKTLAPGLNTYTIRVIAENGEERAYTISITRLVLNTDAALSSLTVNGTSVAGFNANVQTYDVTVPFEISTANVVGTPRNNAARVVSGNGEHELTAGIRKDIEVKVAAEDTTVTRTYTVRVLRQTENTAVEAEEYTVSLFPNPVASGLLTVESATLKEGEAIEIYSVNGALAATYQAAGETTTINVSQLPNGVYLLKAGKHVAKFIKQ